MNLNTIIEEEVEAYKNDYAQAITDVGGFGLAKHIERFLTSAMQRAYEAGKADSAQENTPDTEEGGEEPFDRLKGDRLEELFDIGWYPDLKEYVISLLTSRDTYWKTEIEKAVLKGERNRIIEQIREERDTYWRERVGDINKSFVDFMESFVENGDNEIDLESLEEWRQHTLLDNLK